MNKALFQLSVEFAYKYCFESYPASLRNIDGSIQVLLPEIMHQLAPEFFLKQWKLESHHMT